METYKKLSESELEVTKTEPTPAPVVTKYERAFIEEQIINITKQRDEMIALKEKELAECNAILGEMNRLNIVVKVEEVPVEKVVVDKNVVDEIL